MRINSRELEYAGLLFVSSCICRIAASAGQDACNLFARAHKSAVLLSARSGTESDISFKEDSNV